MQISEFLDRKLTRRFQTFDLAGRTVLGAIGDDTNMVVIVGRIPLRSGADDKPEALLEHVLPVVHSADADHACGA